MVKKQNLLYKSLNKILIILFFAFCLIYTLPLIITVTNSFMSVGEIKINYSDEANIFNEDGTFINMRLIPQKVTIAQYREILFQSPVYLNMFWNSMKITLPVVLGQVIIATTAAYAFTVLKFKYKELIFFIYIIVMLLPLQVTLFPNYIVADLLNLTDSYLAIILPGIFHPFGVFLLRQFMKVLPDGYIEAAQVEGAGHLTIFFKIIIPLVKSGIAAVAMLTFINYWNIVDQAVIFIDEIHDMPMSLFLSILNDQNIGLSFASSSFYVFPVLIILFYGQEYLKEGISLSGMKG